MKRVLLSLVLTLTGALCTRADEAAMKQALTKWEQQMTEYEAARSVAQTDEQRASITAPDGADIAAELWKAISAKTGERDEITEAGRRGTPGQTRRVAAYEFEESWAAPAVFWFMERPQLLAKQYEDKPRRVAFYADALLRALERRHYADAGVAGICAKMAESPSVRSYRILEKVYSRNQNPAARGCAALGMSLMLGDSSVASAEGSATLARGKRIFYLKQALNLTPENTRFGNSDVTRVATELAYILRNLTVGAVPPQLKVRDKDGRECTFPTPGKATLIFFWSPEEEVGRRLVSKGAALRQQYPELTFCAVTAHRETEEWTAALAETGIQECYMDNAENAGGAAYRISCLPTAVLTDEQCRILYIGYPDMKLQTALDSHFSAQKENRPRVSFGTDEEAPVLQPGSRPTEKPAEGSTPQQGDEAPALREMPEF